MSKCKQCVGPLPEVLEMRLRIIEFWKEHAVDDLDELKEESHRRTAFMIRGHHSEPMRRFQPYS